jgi:hypothetical protein
LIEQVDAAELSPGEFIQKARARVEQGGVQTVIIDSLNGYQAAMPEEQSLVITSTSCFNISTARASRPCSPSPSTGWSGT